MCVCVCVPALFPTFITCFRQSLSWWSSCSYRWGRGDRWLTLNSLLCHHCWGLSEKEELTSSPANQGSTLHPLSVPLNPPAVWPWESVPSPRPTLTQHCPLASHLQFFYSASCFTFLFFSAVVCALFPDDIDNGRTAKICTTHLEWESKSQAHFFPGAPSSASKDDESCFYGLAGQVIKNNEKYISCASLFTLRTECSFRGSRHRPHPERTLPLLGWSIKHLCRESMFLGRV